MAIEVGQALPEGNLIECDEFDPQTGCPTQPRTVDVKKETAMKRIVLFAVPGAFTPTCSARHLPGFLNHQAALIAKGVDQIWCVAVNDHFVMAAWGREQQALGKIRMMADGSGDFIRRLGLDRDLSANGLGVRSHRFAMILENGIVRYLGVEGSGQFELSTAEHILDQL